MKKLFLLTLFLSNIFIACKKNKQNTTPESLSNKVSFKINGQLWETGEVRGGIWQDGFENSKYIYLYSYKGSEGIYLYLNRPFVKGTKLLNENTLDYFYSASPKNYGEFTRYVSGSTRTFWITNAIDTGHCTITYIDTVRNFMKVEFSFQARDQRSGEVVNVSDGHFEIIIR